MEWKHNTVDTLPAAIDILANEMAGYGYDSLEIEDETQFAAFADENEKYWGRPDAALEQSLKGVCRVGMYCESFSGQDAEKLQAALEGIRRTLPMLDFGALTVTVTSVDDSDWKDKWKDYYHPTPVGDRLMILPRWMSDTDTRGRIPLVIDPGATFGTGTHATTNMCMRIIEKLVTPGCRVYDLGCGSGILSIAALLLGAGKAIGVDIDPMAVSVSAENALLNDFREDRYQAFVADIGTDQRFMNTLTTDRCDLLLANIVADVLVALAPKAVQLVKREGTMVCSGILDEKLPQVQAAMEQQGFAVCETLSQDGWSAIVCRFAR